MSAKSLRELLAGIADVTGDIRVSGLTLDSRRVRAGDAFIALKGANAHGITFAPAALAQGASAMIAEGPAPVAFECANRADRVDRRSARSRRRNRGALLRTSRPPRCTSIGVTGTNGKTSIVQLLAAALEHLGARAATIGTLGAGLVGAIAAGERTTPDAISVHGLLARFRDAGASHVAMEVSSHALDQGRVNAVDFEVAVFTNLTRDHLDYHGTMQAYGAAKAKLFAWPGLRSAVINADDAFGRELSVRLPETVRRLRYAIDADAEIRALNVRTHGDGLDFDLITPWGEGSIASTPARPLQRLQPACRGRLPRRARVCVCTDPYCTGAPAAGRRAHEPPRRRRAAAGRGRLRAHARCAGTGADRLCARIARAN